MLAAPAFGADAEKAGLDPAARKEALKAIEDGLQWLKSRQKEDGSWSLKQYPAITALAARAILQDPSRPADKMDPSAQQGARVCRLVRAPGRRHLLRGPQGKGRQPGELQHRRLAARARRGARDPVRAAHPRRARLPYPHSAPRQGRLLRRLGL